MQVMLEYQPDVYCQTTIVMLETGNIEVPYIADENCHVTTKCHRYIYMSISRLPTHFIVSSIRIFFRLLF